MKEPSHKIYKQYYMKEQRKSIFNWNHISDELTDEQIDELKSYYRTYHKKMLGVQTKIETPQKIETIR